MYEELCSKIKEIRGVDAEEVKVIKNGVEVVGIAIGESAIKTTLYPKEFGVMETDKLARKIVDVYESHKPNANILKISEDIRDWNKVKGYCRLCVRPRTDDESIVKESFLDLEKYVRVVFDFGDNVSSVSVSKNLMDVWGITTQELFSEAKYDIRMDTFSIVQEGSRMLIISNPERYYGASAITVNDFWEGFANATKEKFYIIPSSVHELLVMIGDDLDAETLRELVRDVNNTGVLPADRLSYSVYEYKAGKVQIAA